MKTYNVLKIICVTFMLHVFVSMPCYSEFGVFVQKRNEEIEDNLRKHIEMLNDRIIHALKNNDYSHIIAMFPDEIQQEPAINNQTKKVFSQVNAIIHNDFKIYDEYYYSRKGLGKFTCRIVSEGSERYTLTLEGVSNNVYVSLLEASDGAKDYLFGVVYTQEDNVWKLFLIDVGIFRIAGKNFVAWYEEARQFYNDGFLAPAILRVHVSEACRYPVRFMVYDEEKDYFDFAKKLQLEIRKHYTFPLTLSDMKSQPVLVSIKPQFVEKKLLPMIYYKTTIPFEHVQELQQEVHEMTPILKSLFPGITKGIDAVVYKAFSELPTDPNKPYDTYGLVVEINE